MAPRAIFLGVVAGCVMMVACGGGKTASPTADTASTTDPAVVARRAVQALINRDYQAFLQEVLPAERKRRPPDTETQLTAKVRDCEISGVSAPTDDGLGPAVTVRFARACGSAGLSIECGIFLQDSAGRLYVRTAGMNCS